MRTSPVLVAVVAVGLFSGCFTRTFAEKMGTAGWFQIDAKGPTAAAARYPDRFEKIALTGERVSCEELVRRQGNAERPILVFVHGVGGDGVEWEESLPILMKSAPASAYFFRWVPYDDRESLSRRLAAGLSRLLECIPDAAGRVVLLAHSAGGVATSFAASQIVAPPQAKKPFITLITVASPLAGTVGTRGNKDGRPEGTFMLDLGSAIQGYPAPADGVRALHLRTSYPADHVMKVTDGFAPNNPAIGIPGARQVNLPETLGHSEALVYAARRVADGTWMAWLEEPDVSVAKPK